jgi:hypothetical protein
MFFATRLIILGLIAATFVVAGVLIGIGIPVYLAITLAFLIVGVVTLAVERRMGREAPAFGIAFMVLSGIFGMFAVHKALPQVNGWIVFLGMLVLEIGALIGVIKLYKRLRGQAGSVFRRRLAARRTWRYEPEATVPVPGPRSAPRFRGVPNDATSTTGRDVVYATANGLNVTVFDRAGARDRKAQTVWLVQLPAALPYVLSSFVHYLRLEEGTPRPTPDNPILAALDPTGTSPSGYGAEVDRALGLPTVQLGDPGPHTDHPDFARTLLTPDVRRIAGMQDFPKRWWIEGWYLCTTADDGAKPADVEDWVDRLTGFASRFPWPALAPYATQR